MIAIFLTLLIDLPKHIGLVFYILDAIVRGVVIISCRGLASAILVLIIQEVYHVITHSGSYVCLVTFCWYTIVFILNPLKLKIVRADRGRKELESMLLVAGRRDCFINRYILAALSVFIEVRVCGSSVS